MPDRKKKNYVALDLGAGSGRAILGSFDGERLSLEEAHRFPNDPVSLPDGLHWDVLRLFSDMKQGLIKAAGMADGPIDGIAVDTWGVDYALLDDEGRLLGNPHHYRDARTDGMLEEAFRRMPREEIFASTGLQFMQINTAFQLLSQVLQQDPALKTAERLLMTPDLFHYWLTGRQVAERTIASTSQCYNPAQDEWAQDVIEKLGLPLKIFPEIVSPGTVLGPLRADVVSETGLADTPVIAVGCHDTASAVAAVPLAGAGEAYLSSGTWSLLGVEVPAPVIDENSLKYNFTNEAGVADTIRLLKNITGLWLTQELRRVWNAEGESLSFEDLAELAQSAEPFAHFIDPDDPVFLAPGDMVPRIAEFCRRTGQPEPTTRGAILRTAYESLAFKYRWVLDLLEKLTGETLHTIHVVGGGSRNAALNPWTASATGRTVRIGPGEATATGNVLLQMIATGQLASVEEGRELVRASFPSETFEPQDTQVWDEAYGRFCACVGLSL